MPDYTIEQKVKSIAYSYEPFEFRGFRFTPYADDQTWGTQDGWIAQKVVAGEDARKAHKTFNNGLYPLVDRIAFTTQCYSVVRLEPYMVQRPDREEFYLRYAKQRTHSSLHVDADVLASLEALESYEERGNPFRYLAEAINSPEFYTRLAMLISALEAIAGESGKATTNKEYIRTEIFGESSPNDGGQVPSDGSSNGVDSFFNQVFGHGSGIRNQLLHGKRVDLTDHGDTPYADRIYKMIVAYFNSKHGTKLRTPPDVTGVPRTIGAGYRNWEGWLRPTTWSGGDLALAYFCGQNEEKFMDGFKSIDEPPYF